MTATGEIYKKDWWQIEAFKRFQPTIEDVVQPSQVHHILDLGCGNGVVTQYLSSLFPNADVVGVDSNNEMIAYAKQNNHSKNITFEYLDINSLENLQTGHQFDLINANYVLHWLMPDEKQQLFCKISKITAPDAFVMIGTCQRFPGFLKFIDNSIRQYLHILPDVSDYVHYFSEKEWKNFLFQHNFFVKGSYKTLDIHPIVLSENIEDPNNFLRIWLWGASAGKAAYLQPMENFSEQFIHDLIAKCCQFYGTEDYYKRDCDAAQIPNNKYAVFEEETLFVIAQRGMY